MKRWVCTGHAGHPAQEEICAGCIPLVGPRVAHFFVDIHNLLESEKFRLLTQYTVVLIRTKARYMVVFSRSSHSPAIYKKTHKIGFFFWIQRVSKGYFLRGQSHNRYHQPLLPMPSLHETLFQIQAGFHRKTPGYHLPCNTQ